MRIYDSQGLPLLTGLAPNLALSAGTQSVNSGTVVFSNSNNVTFGMSGSSRVTASASFPAQTIQPALQSLSAGTTRITTGEVVFSNSNGISFGVDGQTVTASYTVPTVPPETPFAISAGTQSVSTGTLVFSNSNGITFGMSGSSRVTASHDGLTSQSNQAASGQNGSFTFQTLSFSNANGISFGTSAGPAVTASHNAITSQSNQQMTMFATGNTTQSSSGTTNASSLIFRGDGVASVGITNGSVVISVPAGGGGLTNINVSAGTTSQNLSNIVFSNSNGVSFGLNGSTITGSVAGGGITYSGYDPIGIGAERVVGQQGQGTFFVQPMENAPAFQFDYLALPLHFTATSNSSGSVTLSMWFGLYTRNVSTLSLLMSTSYTTNATMSGTVGSYSLWSGFRNARVPWTSTVSASDYWAGIGTRTTTGGAGGMTISQQLVSQPASAWAGDFGVASNATRQIKMGQGFYTATTSAVPGSIAFSQISGSGTQNLRPPVFFFGSATI